MAAESTAQEAAGEAVKVAASVAPECLATATVMAADCPAMPDAAKVCEVGDAAPVDAAKESAQADTTCTTGTEDTAPSPTPSTLPDEPGTDENSPRYREAAKSPKIGNIIYHQLGGRRFEVMTGSNHFVDLGNGLRMRLARNKTCANFLSIIYDEVTDLYTMRFWREA